MNTGANEADPTPSWERLAEHGHVRALGLTVREMLDRPRRAFENMPTTGGLGTPLLFAVLVGTLSAMTIFLAWFWFSHDPGSRIGGAKMATFSVWIGMLNDRPRGILVIAVISTLSPVLCGIWIFLLAGACHLRLMRLGCARRGFETTFRVVSYSACIGFLYIGIPVVVPVIDILLFLLQSALSSQEVNPYRVVSFPALIGSPVTLLYVLSVWLLGTWGVDRFAASVCQGLEVTYGTSETEAKITVRPAKILSYFMVFGGFYLLVFSSLYFDFL